jgi:hypothetical protein
MRYLVNKISSDYNLLTVVGNCNYSDINNIKSITPKKGLIPTGLTTGLIDKVQKEQKDQVMPYIDHSLVYLSR